jgi:hypothetical protein
VKIYKRAAWSEVSNQGIDISGNQFQRERLCTGGEGSALDVFDCHTAVLLVALLERPRNRIAIESEHDFLG